MNFNHLQYWPGILVLFLVLIFTLITLEKKFFGVIKMYWFYRRSLFSYISSLLFVIAMGGLLISLLDLRGPEEKIKMDVPTDRTIILVDTSASMLAEDVKPSRLQKAILMAKHFARKAAGQQVAIVVFAEIQKKIVPFTNDLDLIDSRLDSIKNLKNQYGSSALTHAIQESIQYFQEIGGDTTGNILVFTDGEETAEGIKLKIPKNVHVALVGVGTARGGRIPLDDSRGFRFGYKKNRGQDIITKLNENFFKKAVENMPSGKYWLANSYSLPSEEIIAFFREEKQKGRDSQDMIIKPVLVEWILIPSIVLLVFSYLFKFVRVFTIGLFLIMGNIYAQEEKAPTLTPEIIQQLERFENGKLTRLEKLKLADDLRIQGAKDESLSLFSENLPLDEIDKSLPPEAYLNYGTSLLEKGDPQKAFKLYEDLIRSFPGDNNIKEAIDKNVMAYFKTEERKQEEKKKQEKDKKNDKEDKSKDKGQSKSGDSKDKKGQSGKEEKKDSKEPSKGDEEEKKDKKDSGEEKDSDEDEDEEKKEEDKKDDMKGQENQKPMPPKKIPAKLKQLMYDDRQLQMKMIEHGTRDLNKRKSRKSKDW